MKSALSDNATSGTDRERAVVVACLGVFLVVYLLNAFQNYRADTGICGYQNLRLGESVLQGRLTLKYPLWDTLRAAFPDIVAQHDIEYSVTPAIANPQGEPVSILSVGTAMVYALFLSVSGDQAIWLVPVFQDLLLLVSLFFLGLTFFRRESPKLCWPCALLCVVVYGTVVNFTLSPLRDWFCTSILALASLLVLLAQEKKKWGFWYGSFGLVCLATVTKVTYAMLFLPWTVAFLSSGQLGFSPRPRLLRHILGLALLWLIVFLPFFARNHVGSGHWYLPTQLALALPGHAPRGEISWLPYILSNVKLIMQAQSVVYSVNGTPRWTSLLFVAFCVLGLWHSRKDNFVRTWLLPFVILIYLFYTSTTRQLGRYNVYLSSAYPLVVLMFCYGLSRASSRLKRRKVLLWVLCAMFAFPFIVVKGYRSLPGKSAGSFRLKQVGMLKGDLESILPAGAVLLCDHYLAHTIDYYTHAYSFPPECLESPGAAAAEKISYLISRGLPVFLCDFRGTKGSYRYVSLLDHAFEFVSVKTDQSLHGFPSLYDSPPFNIYRLVPKQDDPARPGSSSQLEGGDSSARTPSKVRML